METILKCYALMVYFLIQMPNLQIHSLRNELEKFFGKEPLNSKDISRIVSSFHFARLVKLLDEDEVSNKVVFGGQRNENQL